MKNFGCIIFHFELTVILLILTMLMVLLKLDSFIFSSISCWLLFKSKKLDYELQLKGYPKNLQKLSYYVSTLL